MRVVKALWQLMLTFMTWKSASSSG